MPARQPEPALRAVEGPALPSSTPVNSVVTSYFLLLVGSHHDDTFPAMAKRLRTVFTSFATSVGSDLEVNLIGRGTM